MDQELLNRLLENTYTNQALIRRLRYMKDFITFRLFDMREEQRQTLTLKQQLEQYLSSRSSHLHSTEDLADDQRWLLSLGDDFFNRFSPETLNLFLKNLDSLLSQLEPVVVYLAIQLPEQEQDYIGRWFKKNLGPQALIEIRYDPSLIGGCALSYKGVYKDLSIRDRLNQNKDQIITSLQSFKHA